MYAYHEHITEDFEHLTDEQWAERLNSGERSEVAWMREVIAK